MQFEYKNELALDRIRKSELNDKIKIIAIEILKRKKLPKSLFVDKNHYLLYNKYFKGYPYQIKISNNYIIVDMLIPLGIKRRYYWYSDNDKDKVLAYKNQWVLGLDSNGKLFINLRLADNSRYYNKTIFPEEKITSDNEIRKYELFYDIDSNDNEIVEIKTYEDNSISYRVQGEIVYALRKTELENLKEIIIGRILTNIDTQLYTIVNTYLLHKVRLFLLGLGFSNIENGRLDNEVLIIEIPNIYVNSKLEDKLNALRKRIFDLLKDDFLSDFVNDSIEVFYTSVRFNRRYANITIRLKTALTKHFYALNNYVYNELKKYIGELISNKVKKTYTVYMSNHKVVIDSIPLEYSITIPKELNPISNIYPENEIVVNANIRNEREFYVLSGFSSTITHNAHGITNITFKENGIVELSTLPISTMHFRYQNNIAFSQL